MPNTIVHKKSSTPGATPSAGSLVAGELAVNTADGVVYLKRDDGAVVRSAAARDHAHGNINNDGTLAGAVVGGGGGSQASLLLHFDGTNGSTTFTDSSGNGVAFSEFSDAELSTTKSRFGGASLYLSGTSSGIRAEENEAFGFGVGDFTVEFWLNYQGGDGYVFFWINYLTGGAPYLGYGLNVGGKYPWIWSDGDVCVSSTPITENAWQHHAVVRHNGTVKIYLDGVEVASGVFGLNVGASRPLAIGNNTAGSQFAAGYIDELRIVKGTAVYTANFTPPTAPFSSGGSLVHSPLVVTNSSGVIVPATQIPATAVSGLSGVAVSGSYNDLTDKPLPAEDNSLTNALIFG